MSRCMCGVSRAESTTSKSSRVVLASGPVSCANGSSSFARADPAVRRHKTASLPRPSPRWSSSAARAHAGVVSVLTPAEVLIAARRLAGARPHLAALAGIVHPEDLWQVCRGELTGGDVRIDGWDIRGRWFGVVVGATPRLGELRRGETIPWRVIAAQIAPGERRGSR
jgi:hypothetical protein